MLKCSVSLNDLVYQTLDNRYPYKLPKRKSFMNDAIVSDSVPRALPVYPPSGSETAYTFLRNVGFILDELCAQGLLFWMAENGRWHWSWRETDLKSPRGFWAFGEALVDAVIARYPETFAVPLPDDELDEDKTA
jgi:hypothetical protein